MAEVGLPSLTMRRSVLRSSEPLPPSCPLRPTAPSATSAATSTPSWCAGSAWIRTSVLPAMKCITSILKDRVISESPSAEWWRTKATHLRKLRCQAPGPLLRPDPSENPKVGKSRLSPAPPPQGRARCPGSQPLRLTPWRGGPCPRPRPRVLGAPRPLPRSPPSPPV